MHWSRLLPASRMKWIPGFRRWAAGYFFYERRSSDEDIVSVALDGLVRVTKARSKPAATGLHARLGV